MENQFPSRSEENLAVELKICLRLRVDVRIFGYGCWGLEMKRLKTICGKTSIYVVHKHIKDLVNLFSIRGSEKDSRHLLFHHSADEVT